jgi:hypothetical protein
LSEDAAIAEKFVVQRPSLSQLRIDMRFITWVLPIATPAVGMMPRSVDAHFGLLTTCLAMPDGQIGAPEYRLDRPALGTATVFDKAPSWLRNRVLYRHC